MSRRENTFRIDYANVPKKPSYNEVHQFIGTVLGLKREQVLRMQCSNSLGCAFVKVVDLATAQKVVEEHGTKHEIVVEDQTYPIRVVMEDGTVEVKLSDLSEDVSDEAVIEFLSAYGELVSIRELLWGENYLFEGIPTGIRVARMRVKTNIPSFVTIDGESTGVSYFGQRQTCRHCREYVHNGVSCIQNKKLLMQKLPANPTYANVAKQTTPTGPKPSGPKPTGPKPAGQKPTGPKTALPKSSEQTKTSGQSFPTVGMKTTGPMKPSSGQGSFFQKRCQSPAASGSGVDAQLQKKQMPPPADPINDDVEIQSAEENDSDGSSTCSGKSRTRKKPRT